MAKKGETLSLFAIGEFSKNKSIVETKQQTVNEWFPDFINNFVVGDSFDYGTVMERYNEEKAKPEKDRSDVFKHKGKFITLSDQYLSKAVKQYKEDPNAPRVLVNHGKYGYTVAEKAQELDKKGKTKNS